MSPIAVGVIGICALFILFILRIPIGFSMAIAGVAGYWYLTSLDTALSILGTVPFSTAASYELSVVPLFVLMGQIFLYSGESRELYDTSYSWLGHLPGGIGMATIFSCAVFAAICGSSPATVATIGSVAYPEMRRFKYAPSLACGCAAAGGTLGILIPPSVILIIYAILTDQSIGKLFLAGLFPGFLLTILFMLVIYGMVLREPEIAPRSPSIRFREKLIALRGAWRAIALFAIVIGGIYLGVFTPTEAAAIGASCAFFTALIRRRLTWQVMASILLETVITTAMIFVILIGAMIFGYFLAISRIPLELAGVVKGLPLPGHAIVILILCVLLLLGCFMDAMSVVILTMPIFFPLLTPWASTRYGSGC
jgi:tripartite ATP-independent transporter DctM subunit